MDGGNSARGQKVKAAPATRQRPVITATDNSEENAVQNARMQNRPPNSSKQIEWNSVQEGNQFDHSPK